MYQVMILSNESQGTVYEFSTYGKARYFKDKHKALGAKLVRQTKNRVPNFDLFLDVVQPKRKERKQRVKNNGEQ